jgi:hypothetical protein
MCRSNITEAGPVASNLTNRDAAGVYDMAYYHKTYFPWPAYPDILDVVYLNWAPSEGPNAGIEQASGMGAYMQDNNGAMMGSLMASMAMGDEAFWSDVSPAIVPFGKRAANDPQMWLNFGGDAFGNSGFDYDDAFTTGKRFHRDSFCFRGTGNGWMADMWDIINP